MKLEYFGEDWGVPMLEDAVRIDTPDEDCGSCEERIIEGDQGVMRYGLFDADELRASKIPYHKECDARLAIGSIGHLLGLCHCHDPNGIEDLQQLTKRQNAQIAWAYFQTYGMPAIDVPPL